MSSPLFSVQTHIISAQHIREYPGATLHRQEDDLKLHIKQYIPRNQSEISPGAITIIGAHANGFQKELYEPLWEDLYRQLKKLGLSVRSIWIADAVHQGMSSVLNEEKLGDDPSWHDHPRDLLHMINHFREEMHRPLVGIGHSAGGTELVLLSIMHPRLLSSLILIEPVIQVKHPSPLRPGGPTWAQLAAFRQDLWPSRTAASSNLQRNPFFRSWDPRVLDLWIQHSFRDLPTALYPKSPSPPASDPPVTLTTTKHQEVFTFVRPSFNDLDPHGKPMRRKYPDMESPDFDPFYRPEPAVAVRNLPHLRPSVLYIFGGKSGLSTPNLRQQKIELTGTGVGGSGGAPEGRVKAVLLPDAGHMVPLEAVGACADAAADWLRPEMNQWAREEEGWRRTWAAKSEQERRTVSEEFKMHLGGDPRAKRTKL